MKTLSTVLISSLVFFNSVSMMSFRSHDKTPERAQCVTKHTNGQLFVVECGDRDTGRSNLVVFSDFVVYRANGSITNNYKEGR